NSADNGGINNAIGVVDPTKFVLANSLDEIVLRNPVTNMEIDRINYDGSFPGGAGVSCQLRTLPPIASANDSAANMCAATSSYGAGDLGSPGAANTCP
ncbi:MAG: hypothetical protein KDA60_19670, partial [Planctomycetales bacterium]|nr:hypothetical protein [Planctomycetales bacterium]